MGNDNYKQGSDFFMTFSGKKEKSILDFPAKSLQNTLAVSPVEAGADMRDLQEYRHEDPIVFNPASVEFQTDVPFPDEAEDGSDRPRICGNGNLQGEDR